MLAMDGYCEGLYEDPQVLMIDLVIGQPKAYRWQLYPMQATVWRTVKPGSGHSCVALEQSCGCVNIKSGQYQAVSRISSQRRSRC